LESYQKKKKITNYNTQLQDLDKNVVQQRGASLATDVILDMYRMSPPDSDNEK